MLRVVTVDPIDVSGRKILEEAGFEVSEYNNQAGVGLSDVIADAWGIIVRTSKITKDDIGESPALKIIGRHGAGVDNIDVEYATTKNILVVNTPDANTKAVAEYVIGIILSLAKGLVLCDREVKRGNWAFRKSYCPAEISGATLGIIGYGRIGKEVSYLSSKLGMNVMIFDPYIGDLQGDDFNLSGCKIYKDIEEVIVASDFLTLHVPYSKGNIDLINYKRIKMMKKTSYIINASRGEVVNEDDLYRALSEEIIAGAAVDVFCSEPPPSNHPFLSLDNIILTPHNAALTKNAIVRASTMVAGELVTYSLGGKPISIINPSVYEKQYQSD